MQFSASLAVARAQPLHADALAALASARSVLDASWDAAMNLEDALPVPDQGATALDALSQGFKRGIDATDAMAQAPALEAAAALLPWQIRWNEHVLHNDQAIAVFNDAVSQYNDAIAQFPASLLARICGFRTARGL